MDLERRNEAECIYDSQLTYFKETLNSIQSFLAEQSQRGIFQISDEVLSELQEQVDFVDATHLNDQPVNFNGSSFTQSYDMIAGSRKGKAKFRLDQAFTGNRILIADFEGKIGMICSELMAKLETLNEHIKMLDSRVAENAIAKKREIGRLLGRSTKTSHIPSAVTTY
ncbi:hypothetical protein Bca101_083370 [Brassica carinata]